MGSTQKKGGSGRCCAMKCQLPAGKTFPFSSWQSYCPWKEHLGSIMAGRRGYKLEGTAREHELLRHFPGAIRHPKTDVLQSVRRAMAVFAGFPNWSGSNPQPPVGGGETSSGGQCWEEEKRGGEKLGASLGENAAPVKKAILVKGGSLGELLHWPLAMCWRRRTHTEEPRTFILEKLCMTFKDPRENHIWFNIRKSRTSDLQWAAWVSVSAAVSLFALDWQIY